MSLFPTIKLKGDPFSMGFAHGRALARQIRTNLSLYFDLIHASAGLERQRALQLVGRFRPVLAEAAPTLMIEMEGIAQGAGVSLESVLVLNARSELMFPNGLAGECTTFGLTGERTINGRTLLAQNWDWNPRLKGSSAFFIIEPAQGPRILAFAEAGQICKIGLNENGLGVLLNILISRDVEPGVPIHALLRMIIGTADIQEAVALARKTPRASSNHALLGDVRGGIIGLELTPMTVAEIHPTSGAVVHTNHFCDPLLSKTDWGPSVIPDSSYRLDRAQELISAKDRWDSDNLKRILTDHENGPSSICRHLDFSDPEHKRMQTVASFILDLFGKRMEVTCGQPCQNHYYDVNLYQSE
ncbi:MAG: hypothetical protein GTO24_06550 [candidate division Zixibacteria bacterium]|nr:hypothetical protein [candidate division Zixibacteria bacterium]